jgi:hypothetical protein
MRYQPSPAYAKRKEHALHKMMRDYHGGNDEQAVHRRADEAGRSGGSENLRPPEQDEVTLLVLI